MVSRNKKIILGIFASLLVLVGLGVWSLWPTVEDIPEVLPELDPELSTADLEIPGQGPMDDLRLGDYRGKRVFLMIEGKESMSGGEGKLIHRAMNRWSIPEDVVGFNIGDAPQGAALMKGKIEREFVGPMRKEMRLPIYVDYGGHFSSAFKLPRGHLGFVILDESGEVLLRHAGDANKAELAEVQALLGAQEPPPGPRAPAFSVGELSRESCTSHACVLVFLDRKVLRSEIPGLEKGGFEGEMKEAFGQLQVPSIRLARVLAADWSPESEVDIRGVVVGEGEGWGIEGWEFVAESEATLARQALGIGEGPAMVIIDSAGRIAFSEIGRIPFWKLSLAADILGIEPQGFGKKNKQG